MWRIARISVHLAAGLVLCGAIFPLCGAARQERLTRRWSRRLLDICAVDLQLFDHSGQEPPERALIVSNHVSWLDIFVINTVHPCHFVAKDDIRSWPLIGWMASRAGTIFLARGKQREVRRIYEGLVHGIEAGKRIAFFPEGTTAAQGTVLPFHANLFEAAIEARVPVQPYALRYVDAQGNWHDAADFSGAISFAESIKMVLGCGGMRAELIRLPAAATEGAHRREVAQSVRAQIAHALQIAD